MKTTSKNSRKPEILRGDKINNYPSTLTARDVERMLREDGFRPIDVKTKQQLISAGHWGMPTE